MKKIVYCVVLVLMLSTLMTGCSAKPSDKEVRTAIENGTLTLEDALDKGYVTQEWIAAYTEENTVPASNKFSANLIQAFTTKDIKGNDFTFTPSNMPVLFLFADPNVPENLAKIKSVEAVYEEIKSAGGDVVLVLFGETAPNNLSDGSIPSIFYTEDLQTQLGSNTEMIDGSDFSASWNMKGSFITAWYRTLDKADLVQTAKDLLAAFTQNTSIPAQEVMQ